VDEGKQAPREGLGIFMQTIGNERKTILVVEDDLSIGEIIALTISEETPFRVCLVSDAYEAFQQLKEIVPVLFLLDYQLPGMSGLQFYDQLCTMPEFAQVPSIMISANLPWYELKKRKIAGLQKPFEIDELLAIVEGTIQ
jgi:DNA-binding response OmpR family regulator